MNLHIHSSMCNDLCHQQQMLNFMYVQETHSNPGFQEITAKERLELEREFVTLGSFLRDYTNGKFSAQKLLSASNRRFQPWLGRKQDEQPGHKDTEAPVTLIP